MKAIFFLTLCLSTLASAAIAAEEAAEAEQIAVRKTAIRKMFQPVLQVELSQFKRAGEPTSDQLEKAIDEGKLALTDFVDKHAVDNNNAQMLNGFVQMAVVNGQNVPFGAPQNSLTRDTLEVAIRGRFRPLLNDDQKARYEQELVKLEDFKRDAVIEYIISILDEQLNLSEKQRADISAKLRDTWRTNWEVQLTLLPNFEHYLPTLPTQSVRPFLDDNQAHIFGGIQQVNFSAHIQIDNQFVIDEFDLKD